MQHATSASGRTLSGISNPRMGVTEVVIKGDSEYQTSREQAAYQIGILLGAPVVPGFVCDGRWVSILVADLEEFSDVTRNVPFEERTQWMRNRLDPMLLARMAVFDYMIINLDRHGGNWGFSGDDVILFDHNLAFDDRLGKMCRDFPADPDLVKREWARATKIVTPSVMEAVGSQCGLDRVKIDVAVSQLTSPISWAPWARNV